MLTPLLSVSQFSAKVLELARKQRMNTDVRRNIFCVIMTSEDYLDAFEKLLRFVVHSLIIFRWLFGLLLFFPILTQSVLQVTFTVRFLYFRLGLKGQQERDIVHVLLDCCLQEKAFNGFYAVLAEKFCAYDRRFQVTQSDCLTSCVPSSSVFWFSVCFNIIWTADVLQMEKKNPSQATLIT